MRTTIDLDPTVLSAARAKAAAEHISLGRAVSELALAGLRPVRAVHSTRSGFPVLHGDPAHPVTDDLVATFRDQDPEPEDQPEDHL
ncbi:hypothetical protein [Corynebacterium provencense]|jgi:hypothetical protein|uniref:hypothetical protein n=1 Tax=Corynebacterium provencense TaxID=1737425 RepID=UPI00082E9F55|nr:hypothetical protein [Corynebacterium provencense]MCI1255683.1 hypothetical protein [Corynebacterium provencense]